MSGEFFTYFIENCFSLLYWQLRGEAISGMLVILFLKMNINLKVASSTFLLVCFLSLKETTYEARKNIFFHFESSFRS